MSMTLRRKMAYQIAAVILGLALLSAASLWGISGLHQDFSSAIAGYQELREAYEQSLHESIQGYEQIRHVYEVSSHVAAARILLSQAKADEDAAMREVQQADAEFRQSFPAPTSANTRPAQAPTPKQRLMDSIRSGLSEANAQIAVIVAGKRGDAARLLLPPINRVLGQVANLEAEIRNQLAASQSAADAKRQAIVAAMNSTQKAANDKRLATILLISVMVAIIITAAVIIGIEEYRSVTRPLARLGAGVRRIAQGDLSQRISSEGHAEFAMLADDFNRMANELDELYRDLEQKVAEKSKHLVRSERLASVGFLAAGVAHEINNPIGIIAGYAEFSLEQLKRNSADPKTVAEAQKALAVISEEAFRCKQIVQKLLSLSRPGEEQRRAISLADVAGNVVSIIGGLKDYKDRKLILNVAKGEALDVIASEDEMKQVVLNLALNALEAVEGGRGRVEISVRRDNNHVQLVVSDNGRGMSPQVLERVFEPFFTAKRGSSRPGTGLGLSITHAIVENHGGEIAAHSDGPGKGSRFVVTLPAAKKGDA